MIKLLFGFQSEKDGKQKKTNGKQIKTAPVEKHGARG
jgi:hypothetical protein